MNEPSHDAILLDAQGWPWRWSRTHNEWRLLPEFGEDLRGEQWAELFDSNGPITVFRQTNFLEK